MGGCMAVEPDPIVEYPSGPAKSFPAQTQAWSHQPLNGKAVAKTANEKSDDKLVKAVAKTTNDKADNTLVKAAYHETKPDEDESPPVNLGMVRLTNSKRITFHYELDSKDSSGESDLEIWGTTDMHNWKKYDTVSQQPTVLVVKVREEGMYGFTMLTRSKGDSSKSPPPASEPPQVWVAVDRTKPAVQLIDTELNVRTQTPALIVRWIARDRNFGAQPITVLYAEHEDGPWRPIAASVENSGRYEGPLPPHLDKNVYVRVQAADLMGNVGQSQTSVVRIPSRSSIDSARASQPAASILSVNGQ
jgi:hypothetical protein